MKKKELQAKIDTLETRVAALETRVHLLEIANTCHKYTDLGGNWPCEKKDTHKYDWWKYQPVCKTNYSVREFI